MEWFQHLPEPLQKRAVDLSEQHIREFAFTLRDALRVVSVMKDRGWTILGGDFYRRRAAGDWAPTYDHWSTERGVGESLAEYVERSITEADAAISRLQDREGLRVVLVARMPDTSGLSTDQG